MQYSHLDCIDVYQYSFFLTCITPSPAKNGTGNNSYDVNLYSIIGQVFFSIF